MGEGIIQIGRALMTGNIGDYFSIKGTAIYFALGNV